MPTLTVELHDSRRLTGPNLVADGPGAAIDGSVRGIAVDDFLNAWRKRAREALDTVGWKVHNTADRSFRGGVTVFHSAPIDALYAATEVNEWAWAAAAADVGAESPLETLDAAAPRLRRLIEEERNPPLLTLQISAHERGVSFLSDDEQVSLGTGKGSRTWQVIALPHPDEVPWDEIHDVPCVLVTGTNGKTTTVRMMAAIAEAAGHTVGFTCTDGIYVKGDLVDAGDWSGPGGARALLRDRRVDFAVLETARGGMLRRGLAVERADASLVTNVAADHLGEWGVQTVNDVANAKLIVAKAVRHGGALVVNADDPQLSDAARALRRPLTWIAVDEVDRVQREAGSADVSWILDAGWLTRTLGDASDRVVEAHEIPATLNGTADYNISNALGAAALADAVGLSPEAIRSGLMAFDSSPEQSPGRGNLFGVGGARVLLDFVHNPHGFDAIAKTVKRLTSERVGLMLGHAGDRDDDAIRELVRAAWRLGPERVAIKEMPQYLRGRALGEIPAIIESELSALGATNDTISSHEDEVAAARALLEWAQPGDFLLFASQCDRAGVLALVETVQASGWTAGAGAPLP